jgi:hypothetical protein
MVDLRDTLADHKGGFERLADKVPGYRGYKEKELRREADNLLRQHLAGQMAAELRRAEAVASQMLTGPGLGQLDDIGQGNTALQTLIDKIKTAAQGYAGFFDAVKVKEDELDTLYQFDEDMLLKVDEIHAAVDAVQAALDSGDESRIAPAVRGYVTTVKDSSAAFDRRKEALLGLV